MRRALAIAVLAGAVAVPSVSGGSASSSTIVPGVRIGKVTIGMNLWQVEEVLGRDKLVDLRAEVAGTPYVEFGWNFSTFSVGFLRHGFAYRAAQIELTIRGQRTTKGIGIGSSFRSVAREYPQAICREYFTSMGSAIEGRQYSTALVVARDRKQLAFLVKPVRPNGAQGPWIVFAVIVRASIPGAVDFLPSARCQPGWQTRGRP